MATAKLAEQTYLPEQVEDLARFHDFLASHVAPNDASIARYMLTGPGRHDQVEVPAEMHRVLLQVVEALLAGKAVTVAPRSMTLTTQQAADLLNISRPTVVKLIQDGEIPCERPGHRRQLRLSDVLEYRERRRQQQYEDLLASEVPVDEDDPQAVLDALKEARHAVAAKRRARAAAL
jgi:excisionase family DNA binding protein